VVVGGNNADGIIAGNDGAMLFANNDASNVMRLDPATGLAKVIHSDTNTGGALSRSKKGALFLASRGLNGGILQLEPQRKVLASSFRGEPLECVGCKRSIDSSGTVSCFPNGASAFLPRATRPCSANASRQRSAALLSRKGGSSIRITAPGCGSRSPHAPMKECTFR